MTLTIQLPENLEAALRAQANAAGVSKTGYVCRVLERDLTTSNAASSPPFETGYGSFAKYGSAPTVEEINANRADGHLLLCGPERHRRRTRDLKREWYRHHCVDEGIAGGGGVRSAAGLSGPRTPSRSRCF